MYREYSIRQGSKVRKICEPLPETRVAIEPLLGDLNAVELHDAAHGFVPGRSIVTNASVHPGEKRDMLTLDIEAFFPSCKKEAVLNSLPDKVDIETIGRVCFYKGALPTGAPSSPVLANIFLSRSDAAIADWCEERGFRYTRYADDLAFSGLKLREHAEDLTAHVRKVLAGAGLRLKDRKSKLMLYHSRQEITGIAVSYGRVRLSVDRRQHYWEHFQVAELPLTREDQGILSFIRSVDHKAWQRICTAVEKRKES